MKPIHHRNVAHAREGIRGRAVGRMGRADQHEPRTEPTRYRESSKAELELCRARKTDQWPGKA